MRKKGDSGGGLLSNCINNFYDHPIFFGSKKNRKI